ncbi:MAG: DUF2304 domain-containing protein [Chloroflexi bacterium]|nr:DUF2304 domain-containing protein [Chloroflexota bacterium]
MLIPFDARIHLLSIAGPLVMILVVLEMVRRRRLREDYSLLWLGAFGVIIVLAILRDALLERIAAIMGIYEAANAMFVIGFALLVLVLFQFSIVITRLARENKQAAQHIALLTQRIAELERKLD